MTRRAAGLLLGLAACGRVGFGEQQDAGALDEDAAIPPPPPAFVNGTRLEAVRAVAAGVARFDGWFDTQVGERCSFTTASDGLRRCLPDAMPVNSYSDAACTVPLATQFDTGGTCGTPAYATTPDGRVLAVGAPYGGTRHQIQGGACVVVGFSGFPNLMLGAEVPASTFVAGSEQSTVRVGAVSYREIVAEDGARWVQPRLHDHVRDQVCDLPQGDAFAGPCIDLTTLPLGGTAFSDATCATPLLVTSAAAPGTRNAVLRSSLCDEGLSVFERGARYTGPVFEHTTTGCVAFTLDATRAAFMQGADVTDEYLRVTPYATTGAGRIGELRWRSADGIDVQDVALLWDHQTGAVCGRLVDDQTEASVCAPVWTSASTTAYSDANCSATAATVSAACSSAHAAIYFPPITGFRVTCDGFVQAPRVYDQPFAPAAAYEWTGTACQPIDQSQHPLFRSNPSDTAFRAENYVPFTLVR